MEPGTHHLTLRAMTPDDLAAVRDIESRAYRDAWPARLFEQELENAFAHYLVAVEHDAAGAGGEVVGFMGVWYMVDQLHLVTIAVDPARQHQGIGQRLLLECLELAREAELDEVVLEVRETNTSARALYEGFGFRKAGEIKGYYKDNGETAVVMLSGPLEGEDASLRGLRERVHTEHPEFFDEA